MGRKARVKRPLRCRSSPRRKRRAALLPISTPSTRWTRNTRKKLGVNIDDMLISQPDSGEQALEIAETLVALEQRRCDRDRFGRRSRAACRARWRNGRFPARPAGATDVAGSEKADGDRLKLEHVLYLYQPASRKDRRLFRLARNDDRRQGSEILRQRPARHPAYRRHQGRRQDGRQPHARQGREKQMRAAVPRMRIRHHVRRRHLARGRSDRSGGQSQRRRKERCLVLIQDANVSARAARTSRTCSRKTPIFSSGSRSTSKPSWVLSRPIPPAHKSGTVFTENDSDWVQVLNKKGCSII